MRDVEVQMNWRHFARTFLVLLTILLSLSGILLARRGFDWFLGLHLALGSVAASLLLGLAGSGVYAVLRKWGQMELHPSSDFVLPLLFLVGTGIWLAIGFAAPLLATVLELGLWLIAGSLFVAEAARRWKGTRGSE